MSRLQRCARQYIGALESIAEKENLAVGDLFLRPEFEALAHNSSEYGISCSFKTDFEDVPGVDVWGIEGLTRKDMVSCGGIPSKKGGMVYRFEVNAIDWLLGGKRLSVNVELWPRRWKKEEEPTWDEMTSCLHTRADQLKIPSSRNCGHIDFFSGFQGFHNLPHSAPRDAIRREFLDFVAKLTVDNLPLLPVPFLPLRKVLCGYNTKIYGVGVIIQTHSRSNTSLMSSRPIGSNMYVFEAKTVDWNKGNKTEELSLEYVFPSGGVRTKNARKIVLESAVNGLKKVAELLGAELWKSMT